jgi:signal transduction histidine kinase
MTIAARLLGAQLTIQSAAGIGTRLRLRIPCPAVPR